MSRAMRVLMRRDGLTEEEARDAINYARQMMAECNYAPDECEDIMLDELGLEMDYIYDVM